MAEIEEIPLFSTGSSAVPERPYFGGTDEAPLFQKQPAPQPTAFPKEQYEKMPWGDVVTKAIGQLGPSAVRSITSIPSAIYNYPETGRALKELGLGAAERAGLYREQDPEARARQSQMIETMTEPFTSVAGFKKTLAEDPYSILTAAATPFGGGLAKAGELIGSASLAGRTLGGLGKAARYAMDPTQAATGIAGDIAGAGVEKFRQLRDISTNVPRYSYEKAAEAGALPVGDIGKAAFTDFASGQGNAVEFSQRARKATEALKNQAMQNWIATKGSLTGAATQDVPFDKIYDAIGEARNRLGPESLSLNPEPYRALEFIEKNLAAREALPSGHPGKTLEGIDQLKQQLYSYAKKQGDSPAGSVVMNVHAGVKNALNDVSPEYQVLMDQYQAIDDQIENIQKSLGTTNKTAANAEIAKFMKAQKTPEGRDLISQLEQYDPVLPFMTAGSTLHSGVATGVPGALEKGSMLLHAGNILAGTIAAGPGYAIPATAAAIGQGVLQSPSLMGGLAYKAGEIGASRPAAVARAIPKVARVAQPIATSLTRARPEITKEIVGSVTPMEEESPYFPGPEEERPVRASGGRIGMTAERLLSMLEGAKRSVQKDTESLLQEPDEKIAKALTIAKEGI